MQERVCTSKTLSGVTVTLNRGFLDLYVQANLLGGRGEKLHCCCTFYSNLGAELLSTDNSRKGETGAMAEVTHKDK